MNQNNILSALNTLRRRLIEFNAECQEKLIIAIGNQNQWFTESNIVKSIQGIVRLLEENGLKTAIEKYYSENNKLVGVFYYKNTFGHIHERSDPYSSSLTTVACGHPLKVYQKSDYVRKGWSYVKTAGITGYVQNKFLFKSKPVCMQAKYPRFFNAMELSLTDMYYWGKLNDMYIEGKSRVR